MKTNTQHKLKRGGVVMDYKLEKGEKMRDEEGRLKAMGCKVCGEEVSLKDLHGSDTMCECGAEYNCSGQRLRPNTYRF